MPSSVYVTGGQVQMIGTLAAGMVVPDGDLSIAVLSFHYEINGGKKTYAGSINNSLTNNSWNYVYLNNSGVLTINTTGFPTVAHLRLAKILTQGGGIVTIDDERILLATDIDSEINSIKDEDEDTNISTWAQKVRVSVTDIPTGTYEVHWYCELKHSNNTASEKAQMKVEVNDSIEIGFDSWPYSDWKSSCGMTVQDISSGSHTIDMDFQASGGGTAYIRRARVLFKRIS